MKKILLASVLSLLAVTVEAIPRTVTRTGPSGLPCPVGRSLNSSDPSLPDSLPGVPNSGAYELSFRAGACGRAQVIIETLRSGDAPTYLDNFIVIRRDDLFDFNLIAISDPVATPNGSCYQTSNPVFPDMAAPRFDLTSLDGFPLGEAFAQAPAEPAGWTLENAQVVEDYSATEEVVGGADIVDDCTMPAVCTGALQMAVSPDQPSTVRFDIEDLEAGVDYILVFWWNIEVGQELSVEIVGCPVVEIPTLDGLGVTALLVLLAAAGLALVRRRRLA